MAWKFLTPPTSRSVGTGGYFSLADCTSNAASSNRNREKPNLSSLPPTHQARSAPRLTLFFMPFLALSQPSPTETLATVVTLSGSFTMSRGLRASRTKNGDFRCRRYFSSSGVEHYYRSMRLSFIPYFMILSRNMIVRKSHIYIELLRRARFSRTWITSSTSI